MKILATNDDGLGCAGLTLLTEALRARGHHVLTIAPDRNRSGASHSITFEGGLSLTAVDRDTYAYGGTPVDCILAALVPGGLGYHPDVVVSGINAGPNLGTDIVYSGTAAAARQGSLYDIPSLAFSVDGDAPYRFGEAASWSADRLDDLLGCWRKNTFVNINYPNSDDFQGYRLTYPASRFYEDIMKTENRADGTTVYFLSGGGVTVKPGNNGWRAGQGAPDTSDWEAVADNTVSVSVIYNHPRTYPGD
jgi:5'-nucleotidase